MSGEHIEIDTGLLRDEARAVAEAESRIAEAQRAIASINLTGGAFGVMCNFLVPPTLLVTTAASSMLAQASGMLQREAEALRDVAREFDENEDDTVVEWHRLGGELRPT